MVPAGPAVISKIHIQGFKTMADLEVELGRLNVFVGQNGSGKTNLLEAVGLLGCAASGKVDNERILDQLFASFCIGK